MRRQITIVVAAVAFTVMLASMTRAQLHRRSPQADSGPVRPDAGTINHGSGAPGARDVGGAGISDPRPPVPARPARYLLRNGLDYLGFRQPQRAWEFLREAQLRQAELTDEERQVLDQAIRQTREALADANLDPKAESGSESDSGARAARRDRDPQAQPARTAARGRSGIAKERRSTSSETPIHLPPLPAPESIEASQVRMTRYQGSTPTPSSTPPVPALIPDPGFNGDGNAPSASTPNFAPTPVGPGALNANDGLPPLPAGPENGVREPQGLPAAPVPTPVPAIGANIGGDALPPLPDDAASSAAPAPAPVPAPAPAAVVPARPPTLVPNPSREEQGPRSDSGSGQGVPETSLPSDIQRDVERIARQQRSEQQSGDLPDPLGANEADADNPGAANQQLFQPRPPSPTEPRPLRGITAPEEFVPLAARQWQPYRKHWAASATCHSTLYFQDPVLERYGQSMETKLGHAGHYLSYPIDDPKQSNQRMQFAQPFFSAGLFGLQIVTLPVKLVLDPPWEAEYDLGYYRPGDRVPPDLFYFPITGIGPPFAGQDY